MIRFRHPGLAAATALLACATLARPAPSGSDEAPPAQEGDPHEVGADQTAPPPEDDPYVFFDTVITVAYVTPTIKTNWW